MRLIDADALCEGLVSNHPVAIAAKCAPTIDAVEVRHGKWEAVENTGPEEWCAPPIRCGNCGKTMPDVGAAFCPFCGQMNVEVQDVPQD